MFTKLAIVLVAFLQLSNGTPLETAQPAYDVKKFFASRIVGGEDAPDGHAKHMVALIFGVVIRSLVCGGSIISHRCVLTAAHCVDAFVHWGELSPSFTGRIGTKFWRSGGIPITFDSFKIHPGWDWATIKDDISVLRTTEVMVFTDLVAPVSLNPDFIGGGEPAIAYGYGLTEVAGSVAERLQFLKATVLDGQVCVERVKEAGKPWGGAPAVKPDIEICTFHSFGHGMCNGDSGSALLLLITQDQIGIVSWGFPCGVGAPDMFVRTSAYWGFIHRSLHELV